MEDLHQKRRRLILPCLLLLPAEASAQHLPGTLVLAALSPLVVLTLACLAAWLERSWRRAVIDVALLMLWIGLFTIFSIHVTTDWIIWTPLVAYAAHALWILVRLVRAALARAHR